MPCRGGGLGKNALYGFALTFCHVLRSEPGPVLPPLINLTDNCLSNHYSTSQFLGHPLGNTLWLHALCVSQSAKLLVHGFCVVNIFLTQRQIRFICGVLMPYFDHVSQFYSKRPDLFTAGVSLQCMLLLPGIYVL